jgi:hypothetical protein
VPSERPRFLFAEAAGHLRRDELPPAAEAFAVLLSQERILDRLSESEEALPAPALIRRAAHDRGELVDRTGPVCPRSDEERGCHERPPSDLATANLLERLRQAAQNKTTPAATEEVVCDLESGKGRVRSVAAAATLASSGEELCQALRPGSLGASQPEERSSDPTRVRRGAGDSEGFLERLPRWLQAAEGELHRAQVAQGDTQEERVTDAAGELDGAPAVLAASRQTAKLLVDVATVVVSENAVVRAACAVRTQDARIEPQGLAITAALA